MKCLLHFGGAQTNDEMGPATKLNSMPKIVVSSRLKKSIWQNTKKIISEDIDAEMNSLKNSKDGDILISGSGTLVTSLMKKTL